MVRNYSQSKPTSLITRLEDYRSNASSEIFKDNKDELRDNLSVPNLSRSTLADQIDYELDNFKINESSIDSSYAVNQNLNSSTLNENKMICADVKPKLMGFLNREKILGKISPTIEMKM